MNSTTEEQNFDGKKAAINKLRELMRVDDKLKNLKSDDAYLERFLYAKDFCVDGAYNTMKTFYELLEEYPEWYSLGTPKDQKNIIDKNIRILTKEHDKEGRLIYIVKIAENVAKRCECVVSVLLSCIHHCSTSSTYFIGIEILAYHERKTKEISEDIITTYRGNMNPSKMSLLDIVAVDDMMLEACLASDPNTVCRKGLCVIIDIADFSWGLTRWLTPANIRTALRRVTSQPIRELRFHVVNSSMFVHLAIKMIWPFLPMSIRESVKFHFNDRESLYQHIDRDVLPEEYGGKNYLDYEKCQSFLYDSHAELVESFKKNRISFLENVFRVDGDIKNK